MITCAICDDEPLARRGIEGYIRKIPKLHLIHTTDNIFQLKDALSKQSVELLFLDIHMPKITGIDFLKNSTETPVTIIITAYPDYALEGYELKITDYLVKPVTFERFQKAVEKAKDYLELLSRKDKGGDQIDYLFIRCDGKYEKIIFDDILFVQAMQNYVIIHTNVGRFISHTTLKSIEEILPDNQFIKTHKSYIVSLLKIGRIEGNEIEIGNEKIPISRSLREEVLKKVLNAKLVR